MKTFKYSRPIVLIFVLVIIGFIGSSFFVSNASAEEIVTVATLEYHPWTRKNLKFNGFVNHVITEAFQRQGYSVKFTYLPWKRAVIETKSGDYTALFYVCLSKDREKEFYLSDPINPKTLCGFLIKGLLN